MARSTGVYFSGSLGPVGSGQRAALYNVLQAAFQSFQSNGGNAWETYSTIAARDIVFRSLGDRTLVAGSGDANLFVRFTDAGVSGFILNTYQDWSTLSATGQRPAQSGGSTLSSLTDTDSVLYYGVVNEYEVTIAVFQGGNRWVMGFGSQIRNHIAPSTRGIARATATFTSGAGIVVPLDRDITSTIRVGQLVWVYDLCDTGAALPTQNAELCIVSAVAAANITLTTVVNNHGSATSRSIIGLDPSPCYEFVVQSSSAPTLYFSNQLDVTYAVDSTFGSVVLQDDGVSEGESDPAPTNQFIGVSGAIQMSSAPSAFRGNPQHMNWWPIGTQADGDRMLPNFDAALAQKVFPGLPHSGFALGIGPGAT